MALAPVLVTLLSDVTPITPIEIGPTTALMRNQRNMHPDQTPFDAAIRLLLAVIHG